ncbi:MAG TPA: hypothetical protein VN428_00555 [Bryobacteraceae bacterium]|nr:hypothetical protein [Bryobacteraceae bacterium]
MRREDIDKLLGGWAAGTLTDAERTALLQAALMDQALFDQLMAEEPLRETLADPVLRGRIGRALDKPEPRRFGWFGHPWAWGLAGSAVATAVMVVALVEWNRTVQAPGPKLAEVQMAKTAGPPDARLETVPQKAAVPERTDAGETKAKRSKETLPALAFEARDAAAQPRERKADAPAAPLAKARRADAADKRGAEALAPPQPREIAQIAEPPALAPSPAPIQAKSESQQAAGRGAAMGVTAQASAPPVPGAPAPTASEQAAFRRQPAIHLEGARALFERAGGTDRKVRAGTSLRGNSVRVMAAPPANALGLRYRILLNAFGGTWAEADPDRQFRPNDALRLEVSVNERAYYYVIVNDSVLASGIALPAQMRSISIPRGTAGLTLIASRVPIATPLDARRRGSEPLIEKSGAAVYVAKAGFIPDERVVTEITLRYEY